MDDCENRGHVVYGSSQAPDAKEEKSNSEIVKIHAYTISKILKLKTSTERIIKFYKIEKSFGPCRAGRGLVRQI